MDAVPIVPPLFRAPKTRHFTSYKQATDHELRTRHRAGLAALYFHVRLPKIINLRAGDAQGEPTRALERLIGHGGVGRFASCTPRRRPADTPRGDRSSDQAPFLQRHWRGARPQRDTGT